MIEIKDCDKCGSPVFVSELIYSDPNHQRYKGKCAWCETMRNFIRYPMFANTLFNWALIPRTMWRQRQAIREYKAILGGSDE